MPEATLIIALRRASPTRRTCCLPLPPRHCLSLSIPRGKASIFSSVRTGFTISRDFTVMIHWRSATDNNRSRPAMRRPIIFTIGARRAYPRRSSNRDPERRSRRTKRRVISLERERGGGGGDDGFPLHPSRLRATDEPSTSDTNRESPRTKQRTCQREQPDRTN